MQNKEQLLAKIKSVFLMSLKGYGPMFEDEDFVDFLAKSLGNSANIMVESSKLAKELKDHDRAKRKLEEFIHDKAIVNHKFANLLTKAYPTFQNQNKQKYVDYLVSLTQGANAFSKYKEIVEALSMANPKQSPPFFEEFKKAVTQGQKDKMLDIYRKNFPEYEKLSGPKYIDYLWSLLNKSADSAKIYPEIWRTLSTPPHDPQQTPPYWNEYKTAQTEMDKEKCREAFKNRFPELHKQAGDKYIEFLFSRVHPNEVPRAHRELIESLLNPSSRSPPHWQEFIEKAQQAESRRLGGDLKELIKKKYSEHSDGQYGAKYLEFVANLAMGDSHVGEMIMKELSVPEGKPTPPKWFEFLRAELGDERLKKLELIRRDPQFTPYIEYRKQRFEQYKQGFMSRTTTEQEQKQFNNMKMYVEQLTTVSNFFQKLLYFNLFQSHFGQIFQFFEKDFDSYKKNLAARSAAPQESHEAKDTSAKDGVQRGAQPMNQSNLAPNANAANPQLHQNYMRHSAAPNANFADSHAQSRDQPPTTKDPYQSQHYNQNLQQSQPSYSQHSTTHPPSNLHSSQNMHQNTYHQQRPSNYPSQPQQSNVPSAHTTSHPHSQPNIPPQSRTSGAGYQQSHANMQQIPPQKATPVQQQPHTSSNYQASHQMNQPNQPYNQTASQPQPGKYHHQPPTQHQNVPTNQYPQHPHAPHQQPLATGASQTMHGQLPLQSPTKQNPLHPQAQPQMKIPPQVQQAHHPNQAPIHQPTQPINQVPSPGIKQTSLPVQNPLQSHPHAQHQPSMPKNPPMGQMNANQYDMMKMQPTSTYEQPSQPSAAESLATSQPSKYQYKPSYEKSSMSQSTAPTSQKSQMSSAQSYGTSQASNQMQLESGYLPSRDAQPNAQAHPHVQPHAQPHVQPHIQPHVQPPVQTQPQVQPQPQPQALPQKAPANLIQGPKVDMKRPRHIEKERFENFNLDGIIVEDGEKRLGDVYKKLKNPYGNYEIIDSFIKNLYNELAESEAGNKIEKRIKTNPDPTQEVNIFPDKAKNNAPVEQTNNKPHQPFVPQPVNPFETDITDIKMDERFKVEDKGNHSSPSFDIIVYKQNDGIISFHDKIVVRLEKDSVPKISIQEMANLSDFFIEYKDMLEDALTKGRLKEVLELWLEFIEKCAMKLESKLSAFDDLFG